MPLVVVKVWPNEYGQDVPGVNGQALLDGNSRTANAPIHYRISLHQGETWGISTGGQDIHGNDVNIAFRIEGVQGEAFQTPTALPRMDRILCSKALLGEIEQAASDPLPATTQEIGAATLKGIHDPVTLYLVTAKAA